MTVKELIEELQYLPQDAVVVDHEQEYHNDSWYEEAVGAVVMTLYREGDRPYRLQPYDMRGFGPAVVCVALG